MKRLDEINKLANIGLNNRKLFELLKLAGIQDFLKSLGLQSDVEQFILSLPNEQMQFYVAEVRKNPQISLEELQSIVQIQDKQSPYSERDIAYVEGLEEPLTKWLLINMGKTKRDIRNKQALRISELKKFAVKKDKKRVDKDIRLFPSALYQNFDYTDAPAGEVSLGGGLYHGKMDKYKSVKEFCDKKERELKNRRKKLESIQQYVELFSKLSGFVNE